MGFLVGWHRRTRGCSARFEAELGFRGFTTNIRRLFLGRRRKGASAAAGSAAASGWQALYRVIVPLWRFGKRGGQQCRAHNTRKACASWGAHGCVLATDKR